MSATPTPARDLGALAVEVKAPESRAALGLAGGQGATLVLAVCRACYPVAERNPGEVVKVVAARLAAERLVAGATSPEKGNEMAAAVFNRRKKIPTGGLEGLVGHDIEVRAVGGVVVRGQLTAVDDAYLYIMRHTGRGALVARSAALVVVDEEALVPHGASRQNADDTFGEEVAP